MLLQRHGLVVHTIPYVLLDGQDQSLDVIRIRPSCLGTMAA